MIFSIYKLRNVITGACYIGQTKNGVLSRWRSHCSQVNRYIRNGRNHPLYNAIRKYGKEAFSITLLAASSFQSKANELEERYICGMNTVTPHGYNVHPGGKCSPISEEHKSKISIGNKGKPKSDSHRRALSIAGYRRQYKPGFVSPLKGTMRPETVKKRISETLTGFKRPPRTEAHRKALGRAQKGRTMHINTRIAIQKAMAMRWDNYRKTNSQHPASAAHTAPEVSASPITVPVVLLAIMALGLTACAHSDLLPNGMYSHQFKDERPNWMGTNTAMTRGAQCPQDLNKIPDWTPTYAEAVKQCQWIQSEWHDASSQGQIGQILGGMAQGMGIGVAGSLIGGGNASATATAGAAATAGSKGH